MKYTSLGKSGLKVSRICLGTNNFGGQLNESESVKIINKAIDLGINLIDTADVYTKGKSEEIIGNAIQGCRNDVILATKAGYHLGLSRRHLHQQINQSLKRLKTSFIDLFYLHRYDPITPLEESLRTLNDFVRDGKIGYIACSNFAAWQIAKAHEICEKYNLEKFIAVQPKYNLLQREIEEELIPYCKHENLGILTYTPLKGGFLTGKYSRESPPPTGSRAAFNQNYWNRINEERNFLILEKLKEVAAKVDLPLYKLAISWILKNPVITGPVIGASKLEHIEENCRLTELNISNDVYDELNNITKL